MKKYVISSGHGAIVGGAVGYIKERAEAVRVVDRVHSILEKEYNGEGYKYHESKATTQGINLANIVNFHNNHDRNLDISVHFNSAASASATGSECLYYDAKTLSAKMSKAMAKAQGIKDRGPKARPELYFLKNTRKPAILLEVCFVSSKSDVELYRKNFSKLCDAIAKVIADYLGYTKKPSKPTTPSKPGNDEEYYKSTDKKGLYRIIKDCYMYPGVKFVESERLQPIKKGEAITAIDIVKYGGTYRLKTKYGYVTAKKSYVEKV